MRRVAGGLMVAVGVWLPSTVAARPMSAGVAPPPCPLVTYHSAPLLDAQAVCMNVGVSSHGTSPGSYLFMTPHSAGAGIFQNNGTLVWWRQHPRDTAQDMNLTVVRLWHRTYLAVWSGYSSATSGAGAISLYNEHYQRVGRITAASPYRAVGIDEHEFRITPEGNALIGISDRVTVNLDGRRRTVIQYVVQKLSLVHGRGGIRDGRVLFQWNSLRDVPLSQSHVRDPGAGAAWDYFHGNAVAQNPDGNLIVSGRNTWGIYKISVRTGHVVWEVGAKGDHTLTTPWCYQHDITPLGHNRYSLFDDGGMGRGCHGYPTHPSRGIIFAVIPAGRRPRIKLVHAYTHNPVTYSAYFGSIQRLTRGDVLINWGTTPEVTEYDASGRAVKLDLSLSFASYRAFQYRWDGQPLTPPAVAAANQGEGIDVWASWNGSTRVRAWRVLAGTTPSQLAPVTGVVPKQGFETTMLLHRHYAAVAVEAIGGAGHVLGTSTTNTPT